VAIGFWDSIFSTPRVVKKWNFENQFDWVGVLDLDGEILFRRETTSLRSGNITEFRKPLGFW
jgi:hypothetical protein